MRAGGDDTGQTRGTRNLAAAAAARVRKAWSARARDLLIPAIETTLIVAGLACISLLPHSLGSDGQYRFNALTELLQDHRLASTCPLCLKYSLIGPVFASPLWLLGNHLHDASAWVSYFNTVLYVLGLLVLYWLLRKVLGTDRSRRFVLLIVAASVLSRSALDFYGEMFSTLCVGVGIVAVVAAPSVFGWLAIALGVANAPASLVGLLLVTIKRAWNTRRVRYLFAFCLAGVLIAAEAYVRRGNPLATGYANDAGYRTVMPYSGLPGFSYPFFFGLLSILFSFGKGLLWFTPGLLLPVKSRLAALGAEAARKMWSIYTLWLAFIVGLIIVYARWWSWYGGLYFGPRFFVLAALPASLGLLLNIRRRDAPLWSNLLTLAVLCLSVWVAACGLAFDNRGLGICVANNYALEALCYYTPEFSALWHPFVVVGQVHWNPHAFIAAEQLGGPQFVVLGYELVVLIYLAAPLVNAIRAQCAALVRGLIVHGLDLKRWRL